MKTMKKLLAVTLAVVMMMALAITANAAGNGSITITLPTDPAPTVAITYKVYKVFDATVNATDSTKVSYTLCSGDVLSDDMTDAGFSVDSAGNVSGPTALDDDAIAAIAAYVTSDDLVATTVSSVGDTSVTIDNLDYGYYYITTTSGTVVTIDTTNPNAEVEDKNDLPSVEKSAGTEYDDASMEAINQVGTSRDFTAEIDVGKGTTNLVFSDEMTNMTYNGDVKVTVGGATVEAGDSTFSVSGETGASSFSVTFVDSYIAGLAAGTTITLNYSGTITSDALSSDPATNTATITSGDGNTNQSDTVEVYNAKFTVTKQDGDDQPLAGAGFVIKNSAGAYYCLASDGKSITWYELPSGTTIAAAIAAGNITEYTSDAEGAVQAFTGLGRGTYALVESTTPSGYNTAADIEFTIADNDFTAANLEQTATVTNEAGVELPSTGGIGTKIFYTMGAVLVIGAGVMMVSKKRAGE